VKRNDYESSDGNDYGDQEGNLSFDASEDEERLLFTNYLMGFSKHSKKGFISHKVGEGELLFSRLLQEVSYLGPPPFPINSSEKILFCFCQ
jgi:hypothetical protein